MEQKLIKTYGFRDLGDEEKTLLGLQKFKTRIRKNTQKDVYAENKTNTTYIYNCLI